MNILVLTASPRAKSNSNLLAEAFMKGATEAGHTVTRFDAGKRTVHPCVACGHCQMGNGPDCIWKDDFVLVRDAIKAADMLVFAMPVYYFGVPAQLKAILDRLFSIDAKIKGGKQAVLLVTCGQPTKDAAEGCIATYHGILKFENWRDRGIIVATDCNIPGIVADRPERKAAYDLGKSL